MWCQVSDAMPVKQALTRPLSENGQLCIPAEFREGVEAYTVVENDDGTLTLHPETNDTEVTQED